MKITKLALLGVAALALLVLPKRSSPKSDSKPNPKPNKDKSSNHDNKQ